MIDPLTLFFDLILAVIEDSLNLVDCNELLLDVLLADWCIIQWIKLNPVDVCSQLVVSIFLRWEILKFRATDILNVRTVYSTVLSYLSIDLEFYR